MWNKIKQTIKKYVIEGLLIVLIGVVVYGVLTIEFKNENFQFQIQTQDQRQWQQTIIFNGNVYKELKFKTQVLDLVEVCNIERKWRFIPTIDLLKCVSNICDKKDLGCSNVILRDTEALIFYWELKK